MKLRNRATIVSYCCCYLLGWVQHQNKLDISIFVLLQKKIITTTTKTGFFLSSRAKVTQKITRAVAKIYSKTSSPPTPSSPPLDPPTLTPLPIISNQNLKKWTSLSFIILMADALFILAFVVLAFSILVFFIQTLPVVKAYLISKVEKSGWFYSDKKY